jgi:hypothetical protein
MSTVAEISTLKSWTLRRETNYVIPFQHRAPRYGSYKTSQFGRHFDVMAVMINVLRIKTLTSVPYRWHQAIRVAVKVGRAMCKNDVHYCFQCFPRIRLFLIEAQQHALVISVRTVEPGYDDIGSCDTSSVTSDTVWYQVIRYCQP